MQALAVDELGNTTQRFTYQQLEAARGSTPMPPTKINLERFANFGDRGTPPGMIGSNNAASAQVCGSCGSGSDEAVPEARYSQRSSRSHRGGAHEPARRLASRRREVCDDELERRLTRPVPDDELERRLTRPVPVVPDDELERRLTRPVPVVPDELELRATRQMPAIPDDDDDEPSDELERRFTRQMPVRQSAVALTADAPAPQRPRSTSGPLPASIGMASSWAPRREEVALASQALASPAESAEAAEPRPTRRRWAVGLALLVLAGLGVALAVLAIEARDADVVEGTVALASPLPSVEPAPAPAPEPHAAVAEVEILEEIDSEPGSADTPERSGSSESRSESRSKSRSRSGQKEHESAACSNTRARAKAARDHGDWETVESLTRKRGCWSPSVEATRLRIQAQFQLGKITACLKTGAGSKDSAVVRERKRCEALAR